MQKFASQHNNYVTCTPNIIHGLFSIHRISCAGELLAHIRTVKMYSWEKLFTERLVERRESEVHHLAVCKSS